LNNNDIVQTWLSRIGLVLILSYCLLASIFFSYFAQMHLSLSFLPFPIFIGEIVMGGCLLLLAGICENGQLLQPKTVILLCLYFGWVLVRALVSYHHEGSLALRNAALFYYPIFAVFGYCFYQKARISRKFFILSAFLAGGILFFKVMSVWYWSIYVTIYVTAVLNTKSVNWRRFGWLFLAFIFLLGKEYFYQGSRAHFVSVLGTIIFLGAYFGALLAKKRHYLILGLLLISLVIYALGYRIFSEQNTVSSLSLKEMIKRYEMYDQHYQEKITQFVPEKLDVHLYNPKKITDVMPPPTNTIPVLQTAPSSTASISAMSNPSASSSNVSSPTMQESLKSFIDNNVLRNRVRETRSMDVNEANIVFRLFVWRDMASELIEKKAWWGFSFGHPQRSKSLEALNWAEIEWRRDGWIAPHNSFFHIIYRAGILGILFIGVFFFLMGRLVGDFFDLNSIEGGFLVGALVYWIILSNFFVILEFPYNAIVIWTLFGITLAYRDELKHGLKKQDT